MEKKRISVEFPQSLAQEMKLGENEFQIEMLVMAVLKLFELGRITSKKAAELLNIKRTEFFELLTRNNIAHLGNFSDDIFPYGTAGKFSY